MLLDTTFYVAFTLPAEKIVATGRQCTAPCLHLRSVIVLSFVASLSTWKSVGEKAQRILLGSLAVTLRVQVLCGISSSFWHLSWDRFCGQPPLVARFCFQTGFSFFSFRYIILYYLPFKYSHVYADTSFIKHNSK